MNKTTCGPADVSAGDQEFFSINVNSNIKSGCSTSAGSGTTFGLDISC